MTRLASPSLLAFVVLAFVLLSCRRVPATLELEPAESANGEAVLVESQTDAKPERGDLVEPLTREAEALYSCWFEDPYPYMFSSNGTPLATGRGDFGTFMAGTRGVLYYGSLCECAARLTSAQQFDFYDLIPLMDLSGEPPKLENPNLPFDTVNPGFVAWARERLLPAADQRIDGVSVQLAYDHVFSRFYRLLGESLFFLLETTAIDSEAATYLHDVQAGVDGIDWLEQRYPSIPSHGGYRDYVTLTAPMAAGFWLRRKLDGSFPACWHGLRDVYEHYDRAWLDDLRARYPKAAGLLAQVPDPAAR